MHLWISLSACSPNSCVLKHLSSLINFGSLRATYICVTDDRERVMKAVTASPEEPKYSPITLSETEVRHLRHLLHELANLFTGFLVTGGLLHHALSGDPRQRYSNDLCEGGERGAALVREARDVVTAPEQRLKT